MIEAGLSPGFLDDPVCGCTLLFEAGCGILQAQVGVAAAKIGSALVNDAVITGEHDGPLRREGPRGLRRGPG